MVNSVYYMFGWRTRYVHKLERWRDRLNTVVLVLPGQWFGLMAYYWLRFYPPLRPFHFDVPFPSAFAFLMGCAASCLPYFLPRTYFNPRRIELGGFYPRLGLRWFRYFATDGDLINRTLRRIQPSYRVIHDRASLQKHLEGTYSNERWHLAFFIAGTLTFCHALHTDQYIVGSLILVTNVIFNLFPVLHQRYKRVRIRRLTTDPPRSTGRSSPVTKAEQSHALEPAVGSVSNGTSSPPAQ